MMTSINPDVKWVEDLSQVFRFGDRVKPRDMLIFEIMAYQSILSMATPIIQNPNRKLGYKFMAAEAAWILSGDNRVKTIAPYSRVISQFSDDGEKFFGAYGPKIVGQLPYVIEMLQKDPDTRQALINIWRESPPPSKDIPCTTSLQFLIRNNHIHCVATMRSSDLWLGHVYDIFNFSCVAFFILLSLNTARRRIGLAPLFLGNLFLTCGSKHIYARNANDVSELIEDFEEFGLPNVKYNTPFKEENYIKPQDFIEHLWAVAGTPDGIMSLL